MAAISKKLLTSAAGSPAFVDGLFVFGLGAVSFAGFESTFAGSSYLLVGLAGLLFGILLAWLAVRLGQPLILLCLLTVGAFFLLGGAMTTPDTLAGALPLPGTLNELTNACIHGWRELVTTLPPIDGGVLLALPYLLGLVGGAVGMTIAIRSRSVLLPVLVPVALLGAVIALGVQNGNHVALVGSAFGLVLIAWVVLRGRRLVRKTRLSGSGWRARGLAAVMCLAALGGAVTLGPNLPGIGDRYVLRSELTPPFDIGQYPSPLAGFRKYTPGFAQTPHASRPLAEKALFTATGLPAGARMQIATMDCYDGLVWAASTPECQRDDDDLFQIVGHNIDNPSPGTVAHVKVTIAPDYAGSVWLPTAGNVNKIDFSSPGLSRHFDDLRYNLGTGTAVLPDALQGGDTYSFTSRIDDVDLGTSSSLDPWPDTLSTVGGDKVQGAATSWSGDSTKSVDRVLALASYMHTNGKYTDGQDGAGTYMAGHSLHNLVNMTGEQQQMAGDDEQYAALLALMGNQLGVPTRVVMGVQAPPDGRESYTFYGRDVHAWVQVRLGDDTWQTISSNRFVPDVTHKPHQKTPQTLEPKPAKAIPPPAPVRPPSNLGDPLSDATDFHGNKGSSFALPRFVMGFLKYIGLPVLLLAGAVGAISLVKGQRRNRRRTRGAAVVRIAAAWRELLDLARDQGRRITVGLTRREQAALTGVAGFAPMARTADAHVFGAGEPSDEDAARYWEEVDQLRRAMTASTSRIARWRSLVNLASFLPLPSSRSRT